MPVPDHFVADGFLVVQDLISPAETETARLAAEKLFAAERTALAGIRDPLSKSGTLRSVAALPAVLALVADLLNAERGGVMLVRAILFDKTPDANWDVAWHQDVTIAVAERQDVAGFGPWSVKHNVAHVQPPAGVLERMVTVRIHLDDCDESNGPLLVVPGSHRRGVVDVRTLDRAACDAAAVACVASAGAAVVMRPLILHASRKAAVAGHRRVLHLEFATDDLPPPLEWMKA